MERFVTKGEFDVAIEDVASGIGTAKPADTPVPGIKIYNVSTAGVYTQFLKVGGTAIEVTAADLMGGLVSLRMVGANWEKVITVLPLEGYVQKADSKDKGTFDSIESALAGVIEENRSLGDTVGIKILNSVNEYWWKDDISDEGLTKKEVMEVDAFDRPDLFENAGFNVVDKDGQEIYSSTKEIHNFIEINGILSSSSTEYDRPDKENSLHLVDADGRLLCAIPVNKNGFVSVTDYDRPDLNSVVYINESGYVINLFGADLDVNEIKRIAEDQIKDSQFIPDYIKIPNQPGFPAIITGVEAYYNLFDQLRLNFNDPFTNSFQYITRSTIGKSTLGGHNIDKWDFKPKFPTKKMLVTLSMHGSEKVFPMAIINALKFYNENWDKHPLMEWFKFNVHLIVVPLLSPFGWSQNGRRVYETNPFIVNWARVGTVATITIDPATFPTENTNIQASGYINATAIQKLYISLIESSDLSAIPQNSYLVQSTNGQYQYTVTVPNAGATTGTVKMYVQVDPNRNFDTIGTVPNWNNFAGSLPFTKYQYDVVGAPNDNKGTKPYSLNESKILKALLAANPDICAYIDFHNGPNDYDTFFPMAESFNRTPLDNLKNKERNFTNKTFTDFDSSNLMNTASFGFFNYGIPSFNAEWDDYFANDIQLSTESTRWLLNLIMSFSKQYK